MKLLEWLDHEIPDDAFPVGPGLSDDEPPAD